MGLGRPLFMHVTAGGVGTGRVRMRSTTFPVPFSLGVQRLGWNIAGKWTGLAGDDSPLVLRDTGSEEIYALNWEAP